TSFFLFNKTLAFLALLPWLIFYGSSLYKWTLNNIKGKQFEMLFIPLFILILPLKIAWITFAAILLLGFSLGKYFFETNKIINKEGAILFFFLLFLLFLLFGQISSFKDLRMQYAFIIIPLAFIFIRRNVDILKIQKAYIRAYLVLLALIIVFGIFFLFLFHEYYN